MTHCKRCLCVFLICFFIQPLSSFTMTEEHRRILQDIPWHTRLRLIKNFIFTNKPISPNNRRILIEAYHLRESNETRRMDNDTRRAPKNEFNADNDFSMKLKLFKLMYETVKDTDEKVRKANKIKEEYRNVTSFEIGFIIGDVSEKYNKMNDIGRTMTRLYNRWEPIEHINAYEQVANLAIEIAHLIDIVKAVHKRNSTAPVS